MNFDQKKNMDIYQENCSRQGHALALTVLSCCKLLGSGEGSGVSRTSKAVEVSDFISKNLKFIKSLQGKLLHRTIFISNIRY